MGKGSRVGQQNFGLAKPAFQNRGCTRQQKQIVVGHYEQILAFLMRRDLRFRFKNQVSGMTKMRIWLAISSFQNDDQVLTTVEKARAFIPELFEHILIVDSEGTDRVPHAIRDRGWSDVEYRNYPENLGSGANLAERLKIAASAGADYIYALNHDGEIHPTVVRKLIEAVGGRPRLGAAYPLGYFTETRSYNLTGTRELPLPAKLVKAAPAEPIIPVYWSSSNGALYSLGPARESVLPCEGMWMAWEDLDYGWRLKDHGYEQILVTNAIFPDNQEYTV